MKSLEATFLNKVIHRPGVRIVERLSGCGCGKMKETGKGDIMSRVRQFFMDLAAPVRPLNEVYLKQYLIEPERQAVGQLRRAELLHTIATAQTLEQLLPVAVIGERKRQLLRAALLHDVGKIRYGAGPIQKTLVVLLAGIIRRIPAVAGHWKAWDIYQHHPEYGYAMVTAWDSFASDPFLYDLIRFHHDPELFERRYEARERDLFRLFCQADEMN